jgi:hypothetical protein
MVLLHQSIYCADSSTGSCSCWVSTFK